MLSPEYSKYMSRARLDKAVNTLLGILQGMAMDLKISGSEVTLLSNWLDENREFCNRHPLSEIIPAVASCLEDGFLDQDERLDLLWICEKLRSTEYYDMITADIQSLHGIVAAISSDGIVTISELEGLSGWLEDHAHLRGSWPYEEVGSLVTSILADKKVDESERRLFQHFCSEFVPTSGGQTIKPAVAYDGIAIKGLCAVCPEIHFPNSRFCFTGESKKFTRNELAQIVEELKGITCGSVRKDLDYLVIGAGANPCWAYACYGRKVEQAVEMRKKGNKLLVVHENDFLDAASGESQIIAQRISVNGR